MKILTHLFVLIITVASCQSQSSKRGQNKPVGGPCEGCEAIFEYGDRKLIHTDTLPDFEQTEPKLKLTGAVFEKDGVTPAKDVILYIYHTDRRGIYAAKENATGWAKRHGYIRGWIKTDRTGQYTFYTFRPAAYPNGRESEHIHITVKEPDKNEYYIDSVVFSDDPLLTEQARVDLENRGGSGIVRPILRGDILVVNRDITLGLNIPNYE